ncbi:hypothetical protein [Methylocystis bryophila]|uniref:hypothetical protein n=1 Tax=Methylocystis bryophila TaxID=655015 RepID=UPI00131A177C|nr:hypothetical protein [Methylocystis bryophila]
MASLLSGCLDTLPDRGDRSLVASAPHVRPEARAGVSPRGASLAFASLDGPSETVSERFREQFDKAVQSRDVALAKTEAAHYRIRGYLTTLPAPGGARLACVLDVYDRQGRRVQRLMDETALKTEANPWDAVDDKSLAAFVDRSAEDLAAFLSGTPEALAAAEKDAGVSVVSGQAKGSEEKPKPSGVAQAR